MMICKENTHQYKLYSVCYVGKVVYVSYTHIAYTTGDKDVASTVISYLCIIRSVA